MIYFKDVKGDLRKVEASLEDKQAQQDYEVKFVRNQTKAKETLEEQQPVGAILTCIGGDLS